MEWESQESGHCVDRKLAFMQTTYKHSECTFVRVAVPDKYTVHSIQFLKQMTPQTAHVRTADGGHK